MTISRSRTISFQIEGAEAMMRKITDPRLAIIPMHAMLEEAAVIGERAAQKAIDGGTGIAVRSINHRTWSRTLTARVYTMIAKKRALDIDRGRKPGNRASLDEIASWHFQTPFRRHWRSTPEERSIIAQKWKAIRTKGTKGKKYILAAREDIEQHMPRLQKRAMQRLEELARR